MTFVKYQRPSLMTKRLWWALLASLMVAVLLLAPLPSAMAVQATVQPSASSISSQCTKMVLRSGDQGKCVRQAQKALVSHGINIGPAGVDGSFGKNTAAGVMAFQKKLKLLRDGVIGSQTWKHLSKPAAVTAPPPASSNSCSKQVLTLGSHGKCVVKLQRLLKARGQWIGPAGADGYLGNDTWRGLKDYQRISNLKVDGLAGPKTWAHLLSGKIKLNHLSSRCFEIGVRVCTDKSDQKTYVFEDGQLSYVMPSRVGGWFYHTSQKKWKRGHTPNGVFSIKYAIKDDTSAMYDDTPMYNSLYFTWKGHAFHGSDSFTEHGNYVNKKGTAGSGGCINLTKENAKRLWKTVIKRNVAEVWDTSNLNVLAVVQT